MKIKKLGFRQVEMLKSVKERGSWYPGCGVIWDNRSKTIGIMESLEKKGLVTRQGQQNHWRISETGNEYLKALNPIFYR